MKANINLPVVERRPIKGETVETHGLKHYLDRLKNWISQYVTIEKDAIFKDPDWPHMWEHKR